MAMMDPSIDEKKIDRIIDKCKAELNQSYYKYGEARKNYGDARVDALGTLDNCLIKFNKTKNTEYLHDAINYLLLRLMFPMPGDHFEQTGPEGSAGLDGTPIAME